MTRRLILLRHSQTAWNAELRAQGHADIGLDDIGRAQAARVAPALAAYAPVALWTSDLARARETASYVATACGLEPVVDPRLREYAVGTNRQARTLAEYRAAFPAEYADLRAGRPVPGRETDAEVAGRMGAALAELTAALGPGECGVAVTHGHSLRTGLAAFLGWPDGLGDTLGGLDNCTTAELVEKVGSFTGAPSRWRLASYGADFSSPHPAD